MYKGKLFLTLCVLAVTALAVAGRSIGANVSDNYPSKPVRVIVPFSAGGGVDIVARTIAAKLADVFKQSFVIENRTGAGGTIGEAAAAQAAPDGHTLLLTSISLAFNPSTYPNLPYDTVRDLAAVTLAANGPNVLVVHPSLPVKSVQELIRFAKARPGKLSYGGGGGASQISAEYFLRTAGVSMVLIPYKGVPPALVDLMAGHIDLSMATIAPVMPFVRVGRLRALGITTAKRTPIMPETPTIDESGLPGFEFSTWYGILATAGSPRAVITKLNAEVSKVVQMQDVRDRLAAEGLEPAWNTPEEFSDYIKAEIVKWRPIIKAGGAPQ